jgi:hypothetical protein
MKIPTPTGFIHRMDDEDEAPELIAPPPETNGSGNNGLYVKIEKFVRGRKKTAKDVSEKFGISRKRATSACKYLCKLGRLKEVAKIKRQGATAAGRRVAVNVCVWS